MEILNLLIIGVVQGVTELLPVSSSAHILLLGKLLNIGISSSLLITFHLGTTLAILIFFWKRIFKNFFTSTKLLFFLKIVVVSIPAALVGFFFDNVISERLRAEWIIALSLIVWGIIMILVERVYLKNEKGKLEEVENVSWKQAIAIGASQALALIPGTSRSGITTITGIIMGMKKYTALEFSFFLSMPILFGTFIWLIIKNPSVINFTQIVGHPVLLNLLTIVISTLIFGIITLLVLNRIQKKNWLTIFGIYRIVLGLIILGLFYL